MTEHLQTNDRPNIQTYALCTFTFSLQTFTIFFRINAFINVYYIFFTFITSMFLNALHFHVCRLRFCCSAIFIITLNLSLTRPTTSLITTGTWKTIIAFAHSVNWLNTWYVRVYTDTGSRTSYPYPYPADAYRTYEFRRTRRVRAGYVFCHTHTALMNASTNYKLVYNVII